AGALGESAVAVNADETVEVESADAVVGLTRRVDTPVTADFLKHVAVRSRVAQGVEITRGTTDRITEIADPGIEMGIERTAIRSAVDRRTGQPVREVRAVEVVVLRHVRVDHQLVQVLEG